MTRRLSPGALLRPPLRRIRSRWRGIASRAHKFGVAARTRKLSLVIGLVDRLGGVPRRACGRLAMVLAAVLVRFAATRSVGLPLRALGHHWAISTAAASAYVLQVAAQPTTSPTAARRLARVSRELGDRLTAVRVLDLLPADMNTADGLAVRADIELSLGRYRRAVDVAERLLAIRPNDAGARRLLTRAKAELVLLDPEWRPPIDGPARPVARTKGRILHLLTNALPYRQAGYTVRSQGVARCQIDIGLDPHMATRAGFPANLGYHGVPATDVIDGVTYHRLEPDLDGSLPVDATVERFAEAASDLVEELRPALLQPATNHVNAQVALALRGRFGVPVVYEVRGFQEESWLARFGAQVADSDRYLGSRAVETACMQAADAVVTLSETMRADIVGRGIAEDRIAVVPNAVDIDHFAPGPRDAALAASVGIDDEPVVGYITTLWRYEGIDYLLEATAALKRRGVRLRCLIVGDGEVRAELEATAAGLGLLADRTVIFTGRVPHDRILDYYRLIDVFVVPRTNDRVSQLVTPLKPYEAMAMERALVVSGVNALAEMVIDGETGRTFIPEDATSLAGVIGELIEDPAARQRLGRNAREWVAAHRTWASNGRRYRELYERLGVA